MICRVEKPVARKLAFDLDQGFADAAQGAGADGLIVDKGAASPVAGQRSPQNKRLAAFRHVYVVFGEAGERRVIVGKLERCGNNRLFSRSGAAADIG